MICYSLLSLQNSSQTNAALGSNLSLRGTVECDASVMDSKGNFGAVGAVEGIGWARGRHGRYRVGAWEPWKVQGWPVGGMEGTGWAHGSRGRYRMGPWEAWKVQGGPMGAVEGTGWAHRRRQRCRVGP